MSYSCNFYEHNLHGNSTFQNTPFYVPPPPMPPPFFIQPVQQWPQKDPDEEFVHQFENSLPTNRTVKLKPAMSIYKVREEICNLVLALKEIKEKEKVLTANVKDLSDEEWNSKLRDVESNKTVISRLFANINNLNIEVLRRLLIKRSAKRARQKRQRIEKKKAKEEWMKRNKENSRKIDEYLQKIQDDINKAKQEEEAKLQADTILRETVRKKQDAKKYIVKLDALVKLRKARQNTAKGRGENISEKEAEIFETNIEKLKSLWVQRLAIYEKEEMELRSKLTQDVGDLLKTNETEREVTESIDKWKQAFFGGGVPQVDFAGDVSRFVAVRYQWDQYLNSEGTCIPIGWVPPT